MSLEELAGAGVQQLVRQLLLISWAYSVPLELEKNDRK